MEPHPNKKIIFRPFRHGLGVCGHGLSPWDKWPAPGARRKPGGENHTRFFGRKGTRGSRAMAPDGHPTRPAQHGHRIPVEHGPAPPKEYHRGCPREEKPRFSGLPALGNSEGRAQGGRGGGRNHRPPLPAQHGHPLPVETGFHTSQCHKGRRQGVAEMGEQPVFREIGCPACMWRKPGGKNHARFFGRKGTRGGRAMFPTVFPPTPRSTGTVSQWKSVPRPPR